MIAAAPNRTSRILTLLWAFLKKNHVQCVFYIKIKGLCLFFWCTDMTWRRFFHYWTFCLCSPLCQPFNNLSDGWMLCLGSVVPYKCLKAQIYYSYFYSSVCVFWHWFDCFYKLVLWIQNGSFFYLIRRTEIWFSNILKFF